MLIGWCMGVTLETIMTSRVTKRAIKIRNEKCKPEQSVNMADRAVRSVR